MKSHTPGPWRYERELDESSALQSGRIENVYTIFAPDHPDWDAAHGEITRLSLPGKFGPEVIIGSIRHEANARLIRAAQDLLELLDEAVALLDEREESVALKRKIQNLRKRVNG